MREFNIKIAAFGDRAGLGAWEVGHYRQHLHYLDVLAGLSPPVVLPSIPLLSMGTTELEQRIFLHDNASAHELIRPYANISGIDLSAANLNDADEFSQWMDAHASEHELLDNAFGL